MESTTKTSPGRKMAAAAMIAAGFLLVAGIFSLGIDDKNAANRDFIEYWASGQQLVHGANPYDSDAVFRIERAAGLEDRKAKVTFSPPVAFFFALPLGYVSPKAGLIWWEMAVLASLSLANYLIWLLNGSPPSRWHLLGYLFAPAIACQMAGQLGTFLLLAILLFFYLHERWPFLAGAVLLPCAWKPHLFLPVFCVLLLWSIHRRMWRVLAGFVATLLSSCGLTLLFDAQVWHQYSAMMRTTGVLDAYIPTLSSTMRLLIPGHPVWIEFLPEALACVWACWYFFYLRAVWNWPRHGLLLLLVSAACTPYGWFSDEAMLLPAVMAGLYCAIAAGRSWIPLAVLAGAALVEVLFQVDMASPFYLWSVPAWFGWYLYATRPGSSAAPSPALLQS